ncbi:MAG: hypothetical protein ACLFVJ_07315 [Persicimonas sp.]
MTQNSDGAPAATQRLEQDGRQLGEREQIYVHAHAFGEVRHPIGDFVVDDAFVRDLQEGFAQLTAAGYFPPVLQQHRPDSKGDKEPRPLENGFSFGRMFDVVSTKEDRARELTDTTGDPLTDTPGVWFGLDVHSWVKSCVDEGLIDSWSPSFYEDWTPPHPELGERIKLAPRHMAFVSVPHQKNTKQSSPHYALYELTEGLVHLSEDDMADEETETEDQPTDNQDGEGGDEMAAKLDEVIGMLSTLMDAVSTDNADEDESEEAPEMSEETQALEARIETLEAANRKLREERTRAELAEAGITDEDTQDELVELSETGEPGEFASAFLKATPKRTAGQQSEKGSTGSAPRSLSEEQRVEKVERELCEADYERGSVEFVAAKQKRLKAS